MSILGEFQDQQPFAGFIEHLDATLSAFLEPQPGPRFGPDSGLEIRDGFEQFIERQIASSQQTGVLTIPWTASGRWVRRLGGLRPNGTPVTFHGVALMDGNTLRWLVYNEVELLQGLGVPIAIRAANARPPAPEPDPTGGG